MELNKDLYIGAVSDYLEDGKQLFNKYTARDGYGIAKSSGAITAENTQCYSDYIPAKPNTSYAFNINFSSNNFGVTFCNSSKTYLSGLSYNEIGNGKTFTTPANTAYIIMTIKIANKDTFMLNKGTSVLPHEEYYGKYLNKADIIKNGIEDYSTNETRIGTWIDGKPLYRKVFTGTLSSGRYRYITSSNNIEKIIDVKGYMLSNNGGYTLGKTIYPGDSDLKSATRVVVSNNNLSLDADYAKWGAATYEVAVEYTKTTD